MRCRVSASVLHFAFLLHLALCLADDSSTQVAAIELAPQPQETDFKLNLLWWMPGQGLEGI